MYLPKSRVRNVLAIGHIEKMGYCVGESCRVCFVTGELCQPVVFRLLFPAPCFFYRVEGSCSDMLSASSLHNLSGLNLTEPVSRF